jgi:acyl-CoA synthetase (AMP-forming)/AMP-acid ligase II
MLPRLDGPPATPPPFGNLLEALFAFGDRPWLSFSGGRALDGAAAVDHAARWAAAFGAAGVSRGDRVALLLPNGPELVGAFFGAQLAGAAAVPLPWPVAAPPAHALAAVAPQLAVARVAALVVPPTHVAACPAGIAVLTAPEGRAGAAPARSPAPEATAFLQFTSGTTGAPRAAVITHRAAVASAWAMSAALELGPDDVGVSWLPLFHDMGLVGVLLCSLVRRFPVHLMTPAEFLLRPERWLTTVAERRATITVAPNFGYELALRRVRATPDLASLRHALDGSEPVLRSTIDRFEDRFAVPGRIRPVYGLAENTLGVAFGDRGAPDLAVSGRTVPSVGRPLAGMSVALGRGDEILVRGPAVMSGYFHDPDASGAALRGGWLHTGDLGAIHDGRLYVVGREKDLVIKGGRKFHPLDIERVVEALLDRPPGGVACVSRPDAASGSEELVVIVESPEPESPELLRRIRGRLLEELDVRADRVRVVEVGTLPRTTSGKLRRRDCAALIGEP